MHAIEFTADLTGDAVLAIPADVAARLPPTGKARIIILTSEDDESAEWYAGAYKQFLREDAPEDAIYDACR